MTDNINDENIKDASLKPRARVKSQGEHLKSAFDSMLAEINAIQKKNGSRIDLEAIARNMTMRTPQQMRAEETAIATAELAARNKKQRDDFIRRTRESGRIDPAWHFGVLATDTANYQAIHDARLFCQVHIVHPEPPALFLLCGGPGSGKSVLANAMADFWLTESNKDNNFKDVCIITPSMLERSKLFSRSEDNSDLRRRNDDWERFCSASLLIVDGLCESGLGLSNFMQKILCELMQSRYLKKLSMVLTLSLPAISYLSGAVGPQTFEAFKEYETITAQLLGRSRRKPIVYNGMALE